MPNLTPAETAYLTQMMSDAATLGQGANAIANNGFVDSTDALAASIQTFETNNTAFIADNNLHGKLAADIIAENTGASGILDGLNNHDGGGIGTAVTGMTTASTDVAKILSHATEDQQAGVIQHHEAPAQHFEHLWHHV